MKKETIEQLALTALFAALVFLLGLTPIGLIPLGFIYVTILCVPVVIGAILLGLKSGLVLGFFFGLVSVITALRAPSTLVAPLLGASIPYVLLMSFGPRLLVPVVTHFVHKLASGMTKNLVTAVPFAAVAGSLTNTVLYLGLMLLGYVLLGFDAKPVLAVIGGTGLIAGSLEAVAAAIIATPVTAALWRVQKKTV